ncbi:hypothetical protein BX666DRAFT_1846765 [Dichotomocladium elegans]|nr:hypothetical protein BX666DRAFT_1846765 [Dichotomocladium elegans]
MPLPPVFFTPSQLSVLARRGPAAALTVRGMASLPPPIPNDASGSIGGVIANMADKLGMGEFATGGLQLAVIGGEGPIDKIPSFYSLIIQSWILNWLSEHPYSQTTSRFSVSTTITRAGQRLAGEGLDAMLPPVYFLPAPGMHLFLTFGRSRDLLQELVLDAQRKFIDRDLSRTVVYAADQYGAWRRTRSRPKRPLSTIVIPPNVKSQLVEDAKEFLVSEQWYSNRGIPYRRGYLLYGTPGSGRGRSS